MTRFDGKNRKYREVFSDEMVGGPILDGDVICRMCAIGAAEQRRFFPF